MKLPFSFTLNLSRGPEHIVAAGAGGELGYTGEHIGKKTSGVPFGAGIIDKQDYNPDLRGQRLYDEFDKMRLSDSQVKGMLQAIKLPLLGATWEFEPGEDTPEQVAIADWLTDQIHNMSSSWLTTLRHILLHLDYGVMPFEVVYEITDDAVFSRPMVRLRKLAPRMPRTIKEWVVDEHGGLAGIVQQVPTLKGQEDIPIPVEKLIIFIHEQEGSNYKGTSLLRAARKDWYYKDKMQRLGGIIMEKRGAGIDVGKLIRGDDKMREEAERVMMDLRLHERAYLLETENFEYRIETAPRGTTLDPLPWVKYYDMAMLRSVLAEFLGIGETRVGSYAMHADKTALFLMSLRALANDITDTFDRHLIPKWCDMNWPNLNGVYPKLRHTRLGRRDVGMVVDALSKLLPSGAIVIDETLQEEVRHILDLPQPIGSDSSTPPPDPKDEDGRRSIERPPQEPEASKDRAPLTQDQIKKVAASIEVVQNKQIAILAREAARTPNNLSRISVPYKTEMSSVIHNQLAAIYGGHDLAELSSYSTALSSVLAERLQALMHRHVLKLSKEPHGFLPLHHELSRPTLEKLLKDSSVKSIELAINILEDDHASTSD